MHSIRYQFQTISSTNTWLKEHAAQFDRDTLILVTADEQIEGRGRFNRKWQSPKGENLYASFGFFLPNTREDIGNVPQLLALSAADLLETKGINPTLKWPNDILVKEKKIGGILTETVSIDDQSFVICGIGLNINMTQEAMLDINQPATSLTIETQQDVEVELVLQQLLQIFMPRLSIFFKEGFCPFYEAFTTYSCYQIGQTVTFSQGSSRMQGTFHSYQPNGAIVLRINGEEKIFLSGECL